MRYVNQDVPDTIFDSDNEYGIPTLDPRLQPEQLALPLVRWGSVHRTNVHISGTWHFYTDDYRFNTIWNRPQMVTATGAPCVIEPNVSTNYDDPRALVLWGIYRKRWIARYWQSCGLTIIVDLNVDPYQFDLALIGVPKGWRAYAIRARSYDPGFTLLAYTLATRHAQTTDILFVVYAGGDVHRQLCQQYHWTWHPDSSTLYESEVINMGSGRGGGGRGAGRYIPRGRGPGRPKTDAWEKIGIVGDKIGLWAPRGRPPASSLVTIWRQAGAVPLPGFEQYFK